MNTAIQFSGGRTSAKMLHLLLEQHGGTLPDDWVVLFQNTGKEREETLQFIADIEKHWNVPVIWLEFDDAFNPAEYALPNGTWRKRKLRSGVQYKVVDFHTASRNGEPFKKLLTMLAEFRRVTKNLPPVLPNVVQRICTAYLKRKVCRSFLQDLDWDQWDIYMGIRKDEADRTVKMLEWLPSNEYLKTPLIDLGIVKEDVMAFWDSQPFDLQLDRNSDEGNCDLCFLKALPKLIKIIQKRPESVEWWKQLEIETGATFSKSKPTFVQLDEWIKIGHPRIDKYLQSKDESTIDCFCGGA